MVMGNLLKAMILMLVLGYLQLARAQDYATYKTPQDWVIAKNYFATYVLMQDTSILPNIVAADKALHDLLKKRELRYKMSEGCKELSCFLAAFKWTSEEIESLTKTVVKHLENDKALATLFHNKLLPSHAYGISAGKKNRRLRRQGDSSGFACHELCH